MGMMGSHRMISPPKLCASGVGFYVFLLGFLAFDGCYAW